MKNVGQNSAAKSTSASDTGDSPRAGSRPYSTS